MPLIKSKSKKAFGKNVSAEMDAGKPQKQALAIAYSIARRASTGGVIKVSGKIVPPSIGGVMSKKPWKRYKQGGPVKKAGGGMLGMGGMGFLNMLDHPQGFAQMLMNPQQNDPSTMTPENMMQGMRTNKDHRNIYNDAGNIVDYDMKADGGNVRVPGSTYDTKLNPLDEFAYRQWVKDNRVPTNPDKSSPQDYDMRGFWQGLQQQNPTAKSAIDPNDSRLHYPDYWKTPSHETFSNESQWANPNSPQWTNDDKLVNQSGRVLFDDRNKPSDAEQLLGMSKADGGGATDDIFNSSDQAAMSPETFVNPYVKHKIDTLASIPQRAIDASAQDVSHLGEEGYQKKSIGPAMETALQGLGNAGVRPTPGVSGVFVGPYGARALREEAAAAGRPSLAHPVVSDAIKPELKGTSPKFRREAEGAQQDIMDNAAHQALEERWSTGNYNDRDIFPKSGWSFGSDLKPRKEVPDVGATLEKIPGTDKYELKHPAGDFHKIYDIPPIVHDPSLKAQGSIASFNKPTNTIRIADPTSLNAVSSVLHELQHAIQAKEGFSGGYNPRASASRPEFKQEYFPSEEKLPAWQQKRIESEPSLKGKTIKPEALARFLTYERNAGETEARNVESRFANPSLYKQHPEDTESVTRGLQWRKSGGRTHMAAGGLPNPPWFVRNEARGSSGMLKSAIPGRTDKIPLNVPGGSYVLPADIPSALGQGNTMAGGTILDKMFNRGPYGMNLPRSKPGGGPPRMARLSSLTKVRKSGYADGGDTHAKIIAAGGEYIIHPDQVASIGGGDIDKGHKVLDAFVNHVRKQHIATLKSLPGPKKN